MTTGVVTDRMVLPQSAADALRGADVPPAVGPSNEMRRFSAGIRAIISMLCSVLLVFGEAQLRSGAIAVLLAYNLWASLVLYAEASGRAPRHPLLHYWVDVAWTVAVVHLAGSATMMMAVTLVQPVVLASIGYGVHHGVVLALCAAAGLLLDAGSNWLGHVRLDRTSLVSALAVLALVPVAALLASPMSVLRRRLELVRDIEEQLDPRRGLDTVVSVLIDALRRGIRADVVGLLLPSSASATAMLSTQDDGAFRLSAEVRARLEPELDRLPLCPTTHVVPRWFGLLGGSQVHGPCALLPEHRRALAELAALLEVRMVIVVPMTRYDRRHGCIVVGLRQPRNRLQEVASLADATPDLFSLVEQASLVDKLQDETTALERGRIGRDLHDSAIQPYLGLKYAVEAVACRVAADNPLRADVDALLGLVTSEISELRDIISGMRLGEARGDNALVPAVRRQVRRFGPLFGIDIVLDCPDALHMSRALAGALFHMVNEAMNNVRKHSPAQRVWISLQRVDDCIELRVRDDAGSRQGHAQPDFEPRSLMERTAALGGTLRLHRPDGLNSELLISVPADAITP